MPTTLQDLTDLNRAADPEQPSPLPTATATAAFLSASPDAPDAEGDALAWQAARELTGIDSPDGSRFNADAPGQPLAPGQYRATVRQIIERGFTALDTPDLTAWKAIPRDDRAARLTAARAARSGLANFAADAGAAIADTFTGPVDLEPSAIQADQDRLTAASSKREDDLIAEHEADLLSKNWLHQYKIMEPDLSDKAREIVHAAAEAGTGIQPQHLEAFRALGSSNPEESRRVAHLARAAMPEQAAAFWSDTAAGVADLTTRMFGNIAEFGAREIGENFLGSGDYRLQTYTFEPIDPALKLEVDRAHRLLRDTNAAKPYTGYNSVEQAFMGAATTLPYMGVAMIPGVGTAAVALDQFESVRDRVIAEGGSPDESRLAQAAAAVAYAYVEKLSALTAFGKPLTTLGRRQLFMNLSRGGYGLAARQLGAEVILSTAAETAEEMTQKAIEEFAAAHALNDPDLVARTVSGFIQEVSTAGTMAVIGTIGTASKSLASRSGRLDRESAADFAARQLQAAQILAPRPTPGGLVLPLTDPARQTAMADTLSAARKAWLTPPDLASAHRALVAIGYTEAEAATLGDYLDAERALTSPRVSRPRYLAQTTLDPLALALAVPGATVEILQSSAADPSAIPASVPLSPATPSPLPTATATADSPSPSPEPSATINRKRTLPNGRRVTQTIPNPAHAAWLATQAQASAASQAPATPSPLPTATAPADSPATPSPTINYSLLPINSPSAPAAARYRVTFPVATPTGPATRSYIIEPDTAAPDTTTAEFAASVQQATSGSVRAADYLAQTPEQQADTRLRHGLAHRGSFRLLDETGRLAAHTDGLMRLVTLATQGPGTQAATNLTLYHEHAHAAIQLAEQTGALTPEHAATLRQLFGDPAAPGETYNQEAVAEAFAEWLADPATQPEARTVFQAIRDFIDRILRALGLLPSPEAQTRLDTAREAVFTALLAGDLSGLDPYDGITFTAETKPPAQAPSPSPASPAPASASAASPAPDPVESARAAASPSPVINSSLLPINSPSPATSAPVADGQPPRRRTRVAVLHAAAVAADQGTPPRAPVSRPPISPESTMVTPTGNVRFGVAFFWQDLDAIKEATDEIQNRNRDANVASDTKLIQNTRPGAFDFRQLTESPTSDGGAPLFQNGELLLSGHGRVRMLRILDRENRLATEYTGPVTQWAAERGLPPPPAEFTKPVLGYRITSSPDRAALLKIAELSNRPKILQRSEAELAEADARLLTPSMLRLYAPGAGGNLMAVSNAPFMQAFARATGAEGDLDAKGRPTAALATRVQQAMLAAVVGTDTAARELIRTLIERDPRLALGTLYNDLTDHAGEILDTALEIPGLSLTDHLRLAVRKYIGWRSAPTVPSLEDHLAQPDAFDTPTTPEAAALMRLTAAGRLGPVLAQYALLARRQGSNTASLGLVAERTPLQLLSLADRETLAPGLSPSTPDPDAIQPAPSPLPTATATATANSPTPSRSLFGPNVRPISARPSPAPASASAASPAAIPLRPPIASDAIAPSAIAPSAPSVQQATPTPTPAPAPASAASQAPAPAPTPATAPAPAQYAPTSDTPPAGKQAWDLAGKGRRAINTSDAPDTDWTASIPLFQGGKRSLANRATAAIRRIMTPAERSSIHTIFDGFGGSGGWGIYHALENFQSATVVNIGEFNSARKKKIRFFHERGDTMPAVVASPEFQSIVARAITLMVSQTSQKAAAEAQQYGEQTELKPITSGSALATGLTKALKETLASAQGSTSDDVIGCIQAIADRASNSAMDAADTREMMYDKILAGTISDAAAIHKAAQTFRDRGGRIEYRDQPDTFAADIPAGPGVMALIDPPYYYTTDYDPESAKASDIVGIKGYRATRDLIRRAAEQGNAVLYTDSAWWIDHPELAEQDMFSDQNEDRQILLDIINAIDHFDVVDGLVGQRKEVIGVQHGHANGQAATQPSGDGQSDSRAGDASGEQAQRPDPADRPLPDLYDAALPGMAPGDAGGTRPLRSPDDNGLGSPSPLPTATATADSPSPRHSVTAKASAASQATDAAYLAAVAAGDLDTAQRMVDDAAKKAGYIIKAWHGTEKQFNQFKHTITGSHWFASNRKLASNYGKISMSVYLKIDKPFRDERAIGVGWDGGFRSSEGAIFLRRGSLNNFLKKQSEQESFVRSNFGSDDAAEFFKTGFGNNAVNAHAIARNVKEGETVGQLLDRVQSEDVIEEIYAVTNSTDIKSAEPVTRDDAGRVIPLSERFNTSTPDIRHQLTRSSAYTANPAAYTEAYIASRLMAGKTVTPAEAAQILTSVGVKADPAQLLAAAQARAAAASATALAQAKTRSADLIERMATDIDREGFYSEINRTFASGANYASTGTAAGMAIERARETTLRRDVETAGGYQAREMQTELGIDLSAAVLATPDVQLTAEEIDARQLQRDRDRAQAEADALGTDTPEAPAPVPPSPTMTALLDQILADARARADADALEDQRRALLRAQNEKQDASDASDPDPADSPTATATATADSPTAYSLITPAITNPAEFAAFLYEWATRRIRADRPDLDPATLYRHPAALRDLQRTAQNILGDLARDLLGTGQPRVQAMKDIAGLTDAKTPRAVMRDIAYIYSRIHASALRTSREDLCDALERDIKRLAVEPGRFIPQREDLRRRVTAAVEVHARTLISYMRLSPTQIAAEDKRLGKIMLTGEEEAFKNGTEPGQYAGYSAAANQRAVLSVYGGMISWMPGQIAEAADAIREQLSGKLAEHEAARIENAERFKKIETAISKAIIRDQKNPQPEENVKGFAGWLSNYADSNIGSLELRLRDLVKHASGKTHADALDAIRELVILVNEGSSELALLIDEGRKAASEALRACYGSPAAAAKRFDAMIPADAQEKLKKQGRDLTYGRALQLYAQILQRDYTGNVRHHGRHKDLDTLRSILDSRDLRLHQTLVRWYASALPRLSAAQQAVTGMPMLSTDTMYTPARMLQDPKYDSQTNRRAWSPIPPTLTPRVKNTKDFDESRDFMGVFAETLDKNARFLAWGQRGIALTSILGTVNMQGAMERFSGTNRRESINEQLTDILAGIQTKKDAYLSPAAAAAKWTVFSFLWMSFTSPMKQISSIFSFASEIGFRPVLKYMVDISPEAIRALRASPGFRARYGTGWSDATIEIMADNSRSITSRIMSLGLTPIAMADQFVSMWVMQGHYRATLAAETDRGFPPAEAKSRALSVCSDLVEKTQQSGRTEYLTHTQRHGGELAKRLFQFITAPHMQMQLEVAAIREFKAGAPGSRARLARTVIVNHVITPAILAAVEAAINALLGKEPPEDQRKVWAERIIELLIGQYGSLFLLGSFAELGLTAMAGGDPRRISSGGLPIFAMGKIVFRAGKTAADAASLLFPSDYSEITTDDLLTDLDKLTRSLIPPYRHIRQAIENRRDQ